MYLSSEGIHEGRKMGLFCPSGHDHSPLLVWGHKKPEPRPPSPIPYEYQNKHKKTYDYNHLMKRPEKTS